MGPSAQDPKKGGRGEHSPKHSLYPGGGQQPCRATGALPFLEQGPAGSLTETSLERVQLGLVFP